MKRNLILIVCIVAMAIGGLSNTVFAADSGSPFSVSLRYWDSALSGYSNYDPAIPEAEVDTHANIPLWGMTLRYSPTSSLDLLFTGYQGEGNYQQQGVSTFCDWIATAETKRKDYELMLRHKAFTNKRAYLLYGFRMISWEDTFTEISPTFVPNALIDNNDITLLQLGSGFSTNITDDGRFNLFANIVVGYGEIENERSEGGVDSSETDDVSSLDLNVGVQWALTDMVSLDVRYRNFNVGDDGFNFTDTAVINGVEAGATLSF